MKCKVCGGTTRKIRGIHYIDGKWLIALYGFVDIGNDYTMPDKDYVITRYY